MTPLLALCVTLAAASLSVVACLLAVRAAVRCSKARFELSAITSGWKSNEKKLAALEESRVELRETISTLSDRYENLRARVGMRETRAARQAEPPPDSDVAKALWKDRMRKELKISISKKQGD